MKRREEVSDEGRGAGRGDERWWGRRQKRVDRRKRREVCAMKEEERVRKAESCYE